MVFWRNEDAVSQVIGTILLVAITVIIAAVIAMYVFGVPTKCDEDQSCCCDCSTGKFGRDCTYVPGRAG